MDDRKFAPNTKQRYDPETVRMLLCPDNGVDSQADENLGWQEPVEQQDRSGHPSNLL